MLFNVLSVDVKETGSSGDVDFFEIKADEQNPLVFKFSAIPHKTIEQGAVKFTSLASQFNNRELMDGKMLQMCWRVSYSQDDQDRLLPLFVAGPD